MGLDLKTRQYCHKTIKNKIKMERELNNDLKNKVRELKGSKFIAVDLWQKTFGPISVKAIFSIYANKFQVTTSVAKQRSFQHCVDTLRKLERPSYVSPKDI